jgi:hypothetical protein
MKKIIRPTYPAEFSIGVLLLVFAISFLVSHQIFAVPFHGLEENQHVYFGMFLVATAVTIMILIMWEEILFPIKVKQVEGGMVFRNHRKKLQAQSLIYLAIPTIFVFIYFEFEVNHFRFFIWAAVCMILPLLEKIVSGINNYNDFLKLTTYKIEYKNNEKVGNFEMKTIKNISVDKDERKIQLVFTNNDSTTIDLDEMELDDFFESIYKFVTTHYTHLLKEA